MRGGFCKRARARALVLENCSGGTVKTSNPEETNKFGCLFHSFVSSNIIDMAFLPVFNLSSLVSSARPQFPLVDTNSKIMVNI